MLWIGNFECRTTRFLALLCVAALGGCSTYTPEIAPVEEPTVVVAPLIVEVPVVETQAPAIVLAKPPRLPPVAIVISSSQPAFRDVANALVEQLDDASVYDLSNSSRPPVAILRSINDSEIGAVVAIGLRAAKSSIAVADAPVVFSQVFNHQDHGLVTDNSRGIAPLAPLDAQLAAWVEFDPDLSRVGIIIGEGHESLITEARLAAQKHNVELRVRVSHSDQETLYLFRRMSQDIDGFWLFPDNRILSARSLEKILDASKRGQIAVAVPNESMLQMGATLSIGTQAKDIAATIARIVRRIHSDGLQAIPAITPLSAIRVVSGNDAKVVSR